MDRAERTMELELTASAPLPEAAVTALRQLLMASDFPSQSAAPTAPPKGEPRVNGGTAFPPFPA